VGTRIYWAIRHMQQAKQDWHFRVTCWWLCQQVEFVEWQLHYGVASQTPYRISVPATEAERQGLAVHAGAV
jgi:hypothetical protein